MFSKKIDTFIHIYFFLTVSTNSFVEENGMKGEYLGNNISRSSRFEHLHRFIIDAFSKNHW